MERSYGFGLNLALPATLNSVTTNSKRMDRDFRLLSVQCAVMIVTGNFSVVLGTEREDWMPDYVNCNTIFGDGALPHYLPGEGTIIDKGNFLVVKARNNISSAIRVALLFQGVLL